MDDIILTESIADPEAEKRLREAEDILIRYLTGQTLRLTPKEWLRTLAEIGIPEEDHPKLTDTAREQGLILPEGADSEREPYRLDIGVRAFLLVKNTGMELSRVEWEVLCFWSGLEDGCPHTPEETGEKFGVSKKRILMVAHKVLRFTWVRKEKKRIRDFYQ